MIFDPREERTHGPVIINSTGIEQVSSYKYLGIQIDNLLKWTAQVEHLCAKLDKKLTTQ